MFIHIVFFWQKPGTTEAQRNQLVQDCTDYLSKVKGVRHCWAGQPAMTPRDVVDNSYDVGLCTVFDDRAAHDAYQVDETHNEFIRRNKEQWARVQVYDFE